MFPKNPYFWICSEIIIIVLHQVVVCSLLLGYGPQVFFLIPLRLRRYVLPDCNLPQYVGSSVSPVRVAHNTHGTLLFAKQKTVQFQQTDILSHNNNIQYMFLLYFRPILRKLETIQLYSFSDTFSKLSLISSLNFLVLPIWSSHVSGLKISHPKTLQRARQCVFTYYTWQNQTW